MGANKVVKLHWRWASAVRECSKIRFIALRLGSGGLWVQQIKETCTQAWPGWSLSAGKSDLLHSSVAGLLRELHRASRSRRSGCSKSEIHAPRAGPAGLWVQQMREICTQAWPGWPLSAANLIYMHSDVARLASECSKLTLYARACWLRWSLGAANGRNLHSDVARLASECRK